MSLPQKRLIFGVLALISITLTLLLLRAGLRLTFDDRQFWISVVGLCLLLETFFVALHFSLKTVFFTRPDVVGWASRKVAAIVAVPVSLLFVLLFVFVGGAMIGTGTEPAEYLIDLGFILGLLGIPAFFLWRHVFRFPRRAKQDIKQEQREDLDGTQFS